MKGKIVIFNLEIICSVPGGTHFMIQSELAKKCTILPNPNLKCFLTNVKGWTSHLLRFTM